MTLSIRLSPISKDNWHEAIGLKVADEQKGFVASNLYSIAEASFYPDLIHCYAVYDADTNTMVGFVMYGWDEEEYGGYSIIRLMVDQRYQRKGYGRAAMLAMIDALKQKPDCDKIYISFEPENDGARALYTSLGFVYDERIISGEEVFRLDLPK